ncbi:hypothetical protein C8R43DRAFT_1102402 [Mycena crocata]|nr:hypothetical protein C8R43DRAFT_1102402 [Mycena crocata]
MTFLFPSFYFAALSVTLALLGSLSLPVSAALANLTIDDANSTFFTFDAAPAWTAISPASPCDYCSARPQTANIHDQTWHDGRNGSSGSFTFQGTAVYIYGIDLANPANISFTLDDAPAGSHYYNGSEQFVFNALFFRARDLSPNASHTLAWTLRTMRNNGVTALFDYAIVTVEDTHGTDATTSSSPSTNSANSATFSSSSKSNSRTGSIAGVVVGVLVLVFLLAAAIFFLLRRRRRNASPATDTDAAKEKPRLGRVRAKYVVQPFVERTPAPPGHRSGGGTSPISTGGTSPISGGAASPVSPGGTSPSRGKMYEATWTDATTTMASQPHSHTQLSSSNMASSLTDADASTVITSSTLTSSARERFLEDRLAILEAHVGQHLPPPYESPRQP